MTRKANSVSGSSRQAIRRLRRRCGSVLDLLAGVTQDGCDRRGKTLRICGLITAAAICLALGFALNARHTTDLERREAQGIDVPGHVVDYRLYKEYDNGNTQFVGLCVTYSYEAHDYRECPKADHKITIGSQVTVNLLPDDPRSIVIVGDLDRSTDISAILMFAACGAFLVSVPLLLLWGAFRRDKESKRRALLT